MKRLLLALLLVGCGFDLPTPPNLRPLNDEYDDPTLELGPESAVSILAEYDQRLRRLESVGRFADVQKVLSELDESVAVDEEDDDQTVTIDGVPLKADAIIRLYARCQGGGDDEDLVARIVVRDSRLVPTVWGDFEDCTIEPGEGGAESQATIWGELAAFAPTLGTDREPVYLIRYALERVRFDGEERDPWSGNLRLVGNVLELLVRTADDDTAVVFGGPDPAVIGVRAANGVWQCFPRERRCDADDSSGASFSY